MKRLLLRSLIILSSLIISAKSYAEYYDIDNCRYTILSEEDRTCELTSWCEKDGSAFGLNVLILTKDVRINDHFYKLVSIADRAFQNCNVDGYNSIKLLRIPTSVKKIGRSAFKGCDKLEYVDIQGTTSMGDSAFADCPKFRYFDILGEEICPITESTFAGRDLSSVAFSISIQNLYQYYHHPIWKNYNLACYVDGIRFQPVGKYTAEVANMYNSLLISGDIPDILYKSPEKTILAIGISDGAFKESQHLKFLDLNASLEYIGDHAFKDCPKLSKAIIPSKVKRIGINAYSNCPKLELLKLPDGIEHIGEGAFSHTGLDTVTIPGSLHTIPVNCFLSCPNLKNVVIEEGVDSLAGSCFALCPSLESVTIPSTMKYMGALSFNKCRNLKEVTIPSSVEKIESSCFANCTGLEAIFIEGGENIPQLVSHGGLDTNIPIIINSKYIEAYKAADGWKDFTFVENTFSVDGFYYNIVSVANHTVELVSKDGSPYSGDVVISPTVTYNGTTYTVTNIGANAFSACTALNSVVIPNSVVAIGENAFADCEHLTSVTVSWETPIAVGAQTFKNVDLSKVRLNTPVPSLTKYSNVDVWKDFNCVCTLDGLVYKLNGEKTVAVVPDESYKSFTEVTIPDAISTEGEDTITVTGIARSAFEKCTTIRSVKLPVSLVYIDAAGFGSCTGLTDVVLPSNLKSLGTNAFCDCSNLKKINLPDGLNTLSQGVLARTSIDSITIPGTVESVGTFCFQNCKKLRSLVINEGIKTLKVQAFDGCSLLDSLIIPSSVDVLETAVFQDMKNLKYIENRNEKPQSISSSVFKGVDVAKVILSTPIASLKEYNNAYVWSWFKRVFQIDSLYYHVTGDNTVELIADESYKTMTQVEIPNTIYANGDKVVKVTGVASAAFANCENLQVVTLPSSLTYINGEAFANCKNLKNVINQSSVPQTIESSAFNGVELSKCKLSVPIGSSDSYLAREVWTSFKIFEIDANGRTDCFFVNNIYYRSSSDEENNVEVTFKDTHYNSYSGDVTIPSSVDYNGITYKVAGIGENAFYACSNLKNVVIPDAVAAIGDSAFAGCKNLASVAVSWKEPVAIDSTVFKDVDIRYVSLNTPLSVYTKYYNVNIWKDFNCARKLNGLFYMPNGNNSVEVIADASYKTMTELNIPEFVYAEGEDTIKVTGIGMAAFSECNSIKSVSFPASLNYLAPMAFEGSTGFTKIELPPYIKSLGYNAFCDCKNLQKINLPEGLESIGGGAFARTSLDSIVIPGSLSLISNSCFVDCRKLKSVIMEEGVDSLMNACFARCYALQKVVFPSTMDYMGAQDFWYCTALKEVTLPNGVKSIASNCFTGCSSLKAIFVESGESIPGLGSHGGFSTTIPVYVQEEAIPNFKAASGWKDFTTFLSRSFTVDGLYYQVKSGVDKTVEVAMKDTPSYSGEIKVPDSVTYKDVVYTVSNITANAFKNSTDLTGITIPASVTAIGDNAFEGCNGLKSVSVSWSEPIAIKENTFKDIDISKVSLNTPWNVLSAYNNAEIWKDFYRVVKMDSFYYKSNGDNTVELVADDSYKAMAAVVVPDTIYSEGETVIRVTGIAASAFANCQELQTVVLPASITTIQANAFADCQKLKTFTNYSSTPQVIESSVFNGVDLSKCTLAVSEGNRGSYLASEIWKDFKVFEVDANGRTDCFFANNVYFHCLSEDENTVEVTYKNTNYNSYSGVVTIPGAVEYNDITYKVVAIGEKAFYGSADLSSVVISDTISAISDSAFVGCKNLKSVSVSWKEPIAIDSTCFAGIDLSNVALNTPMALFTNYYDVDIWKNFKCVRIIDGLAYKPTGENTVELVADNNYKSLSEVTIPATIYSEGEDTIKVTGIGRNALNKCSNLKIVNLPSSLLYIDNGGIADNYALTEIVLPSSIKRLGGGAFCDCKNLKKINLPEGLEIAGQGILARTSVESITIPGTLKTVDAYAFLSCDKLKKLVINEGVQTLQNQSFTDCYALDSVIIPSSLTNIGGAAFANDRNIKYVKNNSETPQNIQINVFQNVQLNDVILSTPLASFKKYSNANVWNQFNRVYQVDSFYYRATSENSVELIADESYKTIKDLVVPDIIYVAGEDTIKVTGIASAAFANCDELRTVVLPSTITNINAEAFAECKNLKSITNYSSTPQTIESSVFNGVDFLNCTLNVYSGNKDVYMASEVWKTFNKIYEFDASGRTKCFGLDNVYYHCLSETTNEVEVTYKNTNYNSYAGDINIPNSLVYGGETFKVVSIGENAFYGSTDLKNVVIADSITAIGDSAFAGCKGLAAVTVAWKEPLAINETIFKDVDVANVSLNTPLASFTKYYYEDIWKNFKLEHNVDGIFYRPNGENTVEVVPNSSYKSMTSVTIPNTIYSEGEDSITVTGIAQSSFAKCSELKSLMLPSSLNYIGVEGFADNPALTEVVLPQNLKSLGVNSFCRNTNLAKINIPAGLETLGEGSFASTSLDSITIPGSISKLPIHCFLDCSKLKTIIIEEGVDTIGNYCLEGCAALEKVVIPSTMMYLGNNAFDKCMALKEITLPSKINVIESGCFENCSSLQAIYVKGGEVVPSLISHGGFNTNTPVYVPEEYISAFKAADGWRDFTSLFNSSFTFDSVYYQVISGIDKTVQVTAKKNNPYSGNIVVPDTVICNNIPYTVTNIAANSFKNNTDLTHVTIPNSVTAIGDSAFAGCADLKVVSVSWNEPLAVAENIFKDINLSNVSLIIPLQYFSQYNNADVWKNFARLYNVDGLFYVPNGNNTLELIADESYKEMTDVTIPDVLFTEGEDTIKVTGIANQAFQQCENLKTIKLPESLLYVGGNGFASCTGLTSIQLPNGFKTLRTNAFYDCKNLKDIVLPEGLDSLEQGALARTAIETITIPGSVKAIGKYGFQNCEQLKTVTINEGVTTLLQQAFNNCYALDTLVIPSSVTTIAPSAFAACRNLVCVVNNSTTPQEITTNVFSGIDLSAVTLNTPLVALNQYHNAEVWKDFNCVSNYNGFFFQANGNNTVALISDESYKAMPQIVVPDSICTEGTDTILVTGIASGAFANCTELQSIVLPSTISSIEAEAFADCKSLTSFTNYSINPQEIDSCVFNGVDLSACKLNVAEGCKDSYLASEVWKTFDIYEVDENGKYILPDFFYADNVYYHRLSSETNELEVTYKDTNYNSYSGDITIPNTLVYNGNTCKVVSIGNKAFYGSTQLKNVVISDSITAIADSAFAGCKGLASVTVAWKEPIAITESTFDGINLSNVLLNVPLASLTDYYNEEVWRFFKCICNVDGLFYAANGENTVEVVADESYKNLTEVVIPQTIYSEGENTITVTGIARVAFKKCVDLTSVTLPSTLLYIGASAFNGCTGITSVTLPKGFKQLFQNAFCDCRNLKNINLPEGLETFEQGVLARTAIESITIPGSVKAIGKYGFQNCEQLKTVTINEGVTTLFQQAFNNCYALDTLVIPSSLTSFGPNTFTACRNLAFVENNSATPQTITSNVFAGINLSKVVLCTPITSYAQYNSADVWKAFNKVHNVNGLIYILTSDSTAEVIANPHYMALTEVAIPDTIYSDGDNTIKVTGIAPAAFADCVGLQTLTLPSTLTYINADGFAGCQNLKSVTNYSATPQVIESSVFVDIDLSACKLNVVSGSKDAYLASEVWKNFNIFEVDENGNLALPEFFYADNMYFHRLASNSTAVEVTFKDDQYNSYSGEVTIPTTVVYNGITCNVTAIGENAFSKSEGLTNVFVPSTILSIGNSSFAGCTNLASLYIMSADSVPSLGTDHAGLSTELPIYVTIENKEAYNAAEGWKDLNIQAKIDTMVSVSFDDDNYTTITLPFDCEVPEGLTVITITGHSGNLMTSTEVTELKAHTPYLLKAEKGDTFSFSGFGLVSDKWCNDQYNAESKMVGTTSPDSLQAQVGDYVLMTKDGKLAFYLVNDENMKVPAYSAVLRGISESCSETVIYLEPITAISNVVTADEPVVDVYNVNGVKIRTQVKRSEALKGLPRGIYIIEGKKVIVK